MKADSGTAVGGLADAFESKLKILADKAILDRSLVTIPMYFLLFMAITFATPISYRFPRETLIFGGFSFCLCLIRLWLFKAWKKFFSNENGLWRKLFLWTYYITSASWGIFCCLTVVFLELGWTSFFVLLITLGLSAASVPTLAPKYSLSKWHLGLMFVPSLVAAVFFVGGLKGYALGAFFTGFFLLLLIQSKIQNIEYWQAIRDQARLQAMVDSLPGTLSWISSDLTYLGVNQQLARLWKTPQDFFVGKKMGFSNPRSSIRDMIEGLFNSDHDQQSKEVELDINGVDRTYYVVASKYHQNSEAVVLGIDVTQYKKAFDELTFRREQIKSSFRKSILGEVSLSVIKNKSQYRSEEVLERLFQSAENFPPAPVSIREICEDLKFIYQSWARDGAVTVEIGTPTEDISLNCHAGRILESLMNLMINAHEAVVGTPKSWIRIEVKKQEFGIELSVADSGKGVSADTRDKIFQPFFTTKDPKKHAGLGLATTREIIENHGGLLVFDSSSPNTKFVISLSEDGGGAGDFQKLALSDNGDAGLMGL